MKSKLLKVKKVVIIGLGSIGKKHLKILKNIRPEIEIYSIRSREKKNIDENNLIKKNLLSLEEAFKIDLDAGIICTPSPFHLDQASKLIKHNIPVLIEKPLSNNLDGIENFKKLVKVSNTQILLGYVLRFSESLNFFYEIVKSGKLGDISAVQIKCLSYLPDWRPDQKYLNSVSANKKLGGGVLLELSHEIDYAYWMFGPFLNIDAKIFNTGTFDIDVEDEAKLDFVTKDNYPVSIYMSFSKRENTRQCIVKSSTGNLIWDGNKNSVTFKQKNGEVEEWVFKNANQNMFKIQTKHFLDCIENYKKPKVTIDDGIEILKIIQAARIAQKEKQKINL